MKFKVLNQKGPGHTVAIVLVIVLAVLVYAGWRVMNAQNGNNSATETTSSAPVEITNEEDLKNAEDALNEENLEDLDTSELEEAEEELL